ncbi:MAG: isoleucine--tRNA ligase, partial [Saprospiraceae bacterium]|nr:isoleucine--tRNA ligase [Saprospiraceae bacterium]
DKGLLYKGYTIQPYSPAAGTGLSTHELNMPGSYKEVSDTTVVAMFTVVRDEKSEFLYEDEEELKILAWTTTPWTLPSNTALAVGPKIKYVKIKTINPYTHVPISVVLAESLIPMWFEGKNKPEIIAKSEPFYGAQLDGIRYEQLLPYGNEIEPLQGATGAFRVILGDFVTTEDGTGVVHTAPSFGADDMKVAKANGIGALTLVDKQGKFINSVGEFSGRYVKDYKDDPNYVNVDVDIVVKLKLENKALNVQKYVHNYPHCWRTDKPVLYYPLDSWFIRSSAMKERMIELNNMINWKPAHTGTGRFGTWLENLQDWNLSRSRYWGIPLPIWRNADGSSEICIASITHLSDEIEKANKVLGLSQKVPDDLHRPYIDNIVLVDDHGAKLTRELDLIDVWFDSGAMPYAQWGIDGEKLSENDPYPFNDPFKNSFPADFIAEGVDQTRGWFYTLHAIATMCFDSLAFKNVVSNGLVLDKNGQKMSKRLGNAIDPFTTIATYGADATRWYMISNSQPWDNLKFDLDGIKEVQTKFFGKFFNTYSFFALYANVDAFDVNEHEQIPVSARAELDQWILSKLHSLIKDVTAHYANYEPTLAARAIEQFVDANLSNWYVRLSRRRFWKGEMSDDKKAAYQTLFECLVALAQLSAPIAPFFSDWIYRNLISSKGDAAHSAASSANVSVHLSLLPKANEQIIDVALEQRMEYAQRISSLILSLRKSQKLRVRQPLSKILLPILDPQFQDQVEAVKDLILAETNIKSIQYVTDTNELIKKKAKPNFKTLGKKLGKNMKEGAAIISLLTNDEIRKIEQTNIYKLAINGDDYELSLEDIEIVSEDIEGWFVANDGTLSVALDVTLTRELRAEGTARELVNRIQNIRKSKDFNVTDRINVIIEDHDSIKDALNLYATYICDETLTSNLSVGSTSSNAEEVELFDDLFIKIDVTKAVS